MRLVLGCLVLLVIAAAALLSLVWMPGDPYRLAIASRLQGPSSAHLLGTDALGRDIAAILMIGARHALLVSGGAVGLSLLAGSVLGLVAAMKPQGFIDQAIARISDLVFAFPIVLLAIMASLVLGAGGASAAIAIAIFTMPVFIRLTRDSAAELGEREFVMAARAMGTSPLRIAQRHILPLLLPRLVVQASTQLALALLAEAGLSYLGLGTPPPHPSWGRMLNEAQTYLGTQPLLAILPGAAIALTVLGFNLVGEGLAARLGEKR